DHQRHGLLERRFEHPGSERWRETADPAGRRIEQWPAGTGEDADDELEHQPGHPERGDGDEADEDEAAEVAETAQPGFVFAHGSIVGLGIAIGGVDLRDALLISSSERRSPLAARNQHSIMSSGIAPLAPLSSRPDLKRS